MTRVALPVLVVLSLLNAAVAQQPSTAPVPPQTSWPPADASRPNKDGVTLPRVLREVRPQYTSEAMSQKIEGRVALECVVETDGTVQRVRVVRSLDKLYGLDDQAIRAAKQWRFAPGMKDNAAIPVLITIELTFVLRSEPLAFAWPELFNPTGDGAADTSNWIEETTDASSLRIRIAYPNSWMMRKDPASNRLIYLQSPGRLSRVVFVEKPKPARSSRDQGLGKAALEQLADAARQRLTSGGASAEVKAVGQVRIGDRSWIWHDLWQSRPEAASRIWTFITTVGSEEVAVSCLLVYPLDASDVDVSQELRHAGADFSAMLKRVSIQVH